MPESPHHLIQRMPSLDELRARYSENLREARLLRSLIRVAKLAADQRAADSRAAKPGEEASR